jgi:hypothetical protein
MNYDEWNEMCEDAIMLDTCTNTNNDDDDNSNGTTMTMDISDNDVIVKDTTKDTTMAFALPPSNNDTPPSIVYALPPSNHQTPPCIGGGGAGTGIEVADSHYSHHDASELLRSAFLQPTDKTFPGQVVGKEDSTSHLRQFGNESCSNNLYNSTDDYCQQRPLVSTPNDNVNVGVGVIGDGVTLRKATNDLENIMDDNEEEEEVLSMMEVEGGDDMAGASDDGSVASSSTIVDYYFSIFGDKATVTEEECANYLRDKAKELKLIQTKLNQIGKGRLYQQLIDNIDLAIIRDRAHPDLVDRTTRESNKTDDSNEAEETDNNNNADVEVLFEEVHNECDREHVHIDDNYVSPYSSQYIEDTNLSERYLDYIQYCYRVGANDKANDTKEFWNKHYAIAEQNAGRPPPKKTYHKSTNPLRNCFLRTNHHGSTKFDKCIPHPPFDWERDVRGMPLFEREGQVYTVLKVLPEIRRLRDAMYKATGRNVAMFPRVAGTDHSKIVKNFYNSDCLLAHIGKEVDNLKQRVRQNDSEIARRVLEVMKREAGLVTENSGELNIYNSRSGVDDGRSKYYCGVLYQVAGLTLLEHMTQYNMNEEVKTLVQQVRDNEKYQALEPLRAAQQRVTEELMQKSDEMQQFILNNDPSDCMIFKWVISILGGAGSSCRHCGARQECNGHTFRGASFIQHVAHVSDIGRHAKVTIVGGRHPSKCTFLELLQQLPVVELMCGEDHIGKEDNWKLAELITGDSDYSIQKKPTYSWKKIYRARVAVQVMHALSNGKCQLDLSYVWKFCMKGGMDLHHLSMGLGFIDTNGVSWETGKSTEENYKGFFVQIMQAPEAQWRTILVNECSICAIASSSGHQLLHKVYGPNSINQLKEHLGIEFGWRESNTHIIMLPQEEEEE